MQALQQQSSELEAQLQGEIDALGVTYDAQTETPDRIPIKAKSGDVQVQLVALLWKPTGAGG